MFPVFESSEGEIRTAALAQILADGGAGEILVLLDAGDGTRMDAYSFLLPLLRRKHPVVTVWLLEGWTGGGQPPSVGELVEKARAAILDLGPERAITLIGFSLAGMVAAAYAASYAGVGRLVVVSAALASSPRHRSFARTWSRARSFGTEGLRDFAMYALLSPAYHEDPRPSDAAALDAIITAPTADVAVEIFAAADISHLALLISTPALVVGCSGDQVAGVEQSQALFAAIPSARYAEIDSGHAALVERPAEVLSLLEQFLRDPHRHAPSSVISLDAP
jgi:pimeloyl-ACP methyl ester carboxylesterase